MIRVKKIAHAVYEMPDVDKQTEYYTDVLGLTQTGKDKEAVYLASTVDHHSVVLCKGSQPKCVRLGFQIAPEDDLGAFEKEVQGHGIKTQRRKDAEPTISDMTSGYVADGLSTHRPVVEEEPMATILTASPPLRRATVRGSGAPKARARFAARQISASDRLAGVCASAPPA